MAHRRGRTELRIPRVAGTESARLFVWGLLALLVLAARGGPAEPGPLVLVGTPAGCRLERAGPGPACPCEALDGRLRRLLGLPLLLDHASARDLETLPGVGPQRAAAIVQERERGGGFAHIEDLERVPGLGPRSVARLRPWLIVGGPDPACAHPALRPPR